MHLKRVQAADLWSFPRDQPLDVEFDRKLTVIVGQNNSGKSNVLRPVRLLVARDLSNGNTGCSRLSRRELFQDQSTAFVPNPRLTVTISIDQTELPSDVHIAGKLLGTQLPTSDGLYEFCATPQAGLSTQQVLEWSSNFERPGQYHFPDPALLKTLHDNIVRKLILIRSWRRLTELTLSERTFLTAMRAAHGAGPDDRESALHWERFLSVFRALTKMSDVEVIPSADTAKASSQTVSLKRGTVHLDITNYGDGIQHLLMIAFEASRGNRGVLFIEEPETGLHPRLQRQLLSVLRHAQEELGDDANQIIITTHSPVLLDQGAAPKVIRVVHDGIKSVVETPKTTPAMYTLLDDLGALASGVLQTNLAIWVEGPSDRVFLRKALSLVAPEYSEGVHFQFVCYGGALRAHYTVGGDAESFVDVLRLSRNTVFIMDRDTDDDAAPLDPHKQRVVDECNSQKRLAWVTAGREIENYLSPEVMRRAFERAGGSAPSITVAPFDSFADVMEDSVPAASPKLSVFRSYGRNKVKAMHEFVDCMEESDLHVLDLSVRLHQIKAAIESANR